MAHLDHCVTLAKLTLNFFSSTFQKTEKKPKIDLFSCCSRSKTPYLRAFFNQEMNSGGENRFVGYTVGEKFVFGSKMTKFVVIWSPTSHIN